MDKLLRRRRAVGSAFDADAQAYFTAGSITDLTFKNSWNTWVTTMKTAGVWPLVSRVWPMNDDNATAAALCAKTLTSMTPVNLTIGPAGYQTDAVSSYLNTNFNPLNSSGTQITSTTGFYGIWAYFGYESDGTFMGSRDGTTVYDGMSVVGGLNAAMSVASSSANRVSGDYDAGASYFVRRNGTTQTGYQLGNLVAISIAAGITPSSKSLFIGANNGNGTPEDYCAGLWTFAIAAAYLDDTQFSALRTATDTFLASNGKSES